MVDTIVIRVHDLRVHENLVNEINVIFKGTTKNTYHLSEEERNMIRQSPVIDTKNFIEYFADTRNGRPHHIHYRSLEKINNSGHYLLNAFINDDRDFIEFNFSIPKFIYGTNVKMFCEHYKNKNFNYFLNSQLDYNLKRAYELLIAFIPHFFNKEFTGTNIVDYSLVEINRIDLSFNQIFDSKKYALEYLEYQKKLKKKNLRADSNNYREYATSLMYYTHRYSLKIYHKGAEYTKHDRKEHEKVNRKKGSEYFNIAELQTFSDRMLRYEVTFRDSMLSYLYNNNVFRKNCPIHKARYEIFKKVESLKKKNDTIAKRTGSFKLDSFKSRYIENHPYIKIDKAELAIHKKMTHLLNRKRRFHLKVNQSVKDFNSKTISGCFDPRALFCKGLFLECARFFKKFIKDFQVSEKPSECVVKDRIDQYNSSHYHQLPHNEMMKFYALLQNFSFEEILKKGIYSKATFYRYKSRFEKIGVTQNNIMLSDFIHAPVDLSQYHTHLIYNKPLINN